MNEPGKKGQQKPAEKLASPPDQPEMLAAHTELKLLTETQEARITDLNAALRDCDQRSQDLENLARRLQAEFDNFRKQSEKERSEMQMYASATLVRKLLPLLDEFEHSLTEAKKHHAAKDVLHGFSMVYENLRKTLEAEGLKDMTAGQESFDPYKHEAIRSEESGVEEGKIAVVLKKGYYFRDRILRPAAVVVSKGKVTKGKPMESGEGGKNG